MQFKTQLFVSLSWYM